MYLYKCQEGHEKLYKNKISFEKAVNNNLCAECNRQRRQIENVPSRNCPKCGDIITYNLRHSWYMANRYNRNCIVCDKARRFGEGNSFYGKKHSEELKARLSNKLKGIPLSEARINKLKEYYKTHASNGGSPFDFWVKKYGEEVAQQKLHESNIKKSKASSGKNNPMYGKPSPKGSGNGWSGWYKGWFFRSLLELSYLIEYIEANNYAWINAESVEYRIKYKDYEGKERNYYPDFVLPDLKHVIEVKPLKLHNTPKVLAKKLAAIDFFAEKGYEYKLVACEKMSLERLNDLVENNSIKFLPKYQKKFQDWKQKNA